jgi:undecaprenyl-diphosphatase
MRDSRISSQAERDRVFPLTIGTVAFVFFVWLGFGVRDHGEPLTFIYWETAIVNHGALLAWWLTWACYVQVLVPIAVILIVVAVVAPAWRARIVFSIAMLLLCWLCADYFQHVFARPRRLDWVVKHETAFSYPSSHAAIATGFYLLWAVIIDISELPRAVRLTCATLLALLTLGIYWSRLALGAHFLTDIGGGVLLAIALVSAGYAAVAPNVFGVRSNQR